MIPERSAWAAMRRRPVASGWTIERAICAALAGRAVLLSAPYAGSRAGLRPSRGREYRAGHKGRYAARRGRSQLGFCGRVIGWRRRKFMYRRVDEVSSSTSTGGAAAYSGTVRRAGAGCSVQVDAVAQPGSSGVHRWADVNPCRRSPSVVGELVREDAITSRPRTARSSVKADCPIASPVTRFRAGSSRSDRPIPAA